MRGFRTRGILPNQPLCKLEFQLKEKTRSMKGTLSGLRMVQYISCWCEQTKTWRISQDVFTGFQSTNAGALLFVQGQILFWLDVPKKELTDINNLSKRKIQCWTLPLASQPCPQGFSPPHPFFKGKPWGRGWLASQSSSRLQSILWPIIDPILATFGQICNFRDPNLVTFFIMYLIIIK